MYDSTSFLVFVGLCLGGFIGSAIIFFKSNNELSKNDIKKIEKKNKRPVTEQDIIDEKIKLGKNGKIGIVAFPIIFIFFMLLLNFIA